MKTRGAVKKTPGPKKGGAKTPIKAPVEGDVEDTITSPEEVPQSESLQSPSVEAKSDGEDKIPEETNVDSVIRDDIEVSGVIAGSKAADVVETIDGQISPSLGEVSKPKADEGSEKKGELSIQSTIPKEPKNEGSEVVESAADAEAQVSTGDILKDTVTVVDGVDPGEEDEAESEEEAEDSEVDEVEDEAEDEVEDMDEDEVEEVNEEGTQVDDEVEDAEVEEDEAEENKAQKEIYNIAKDEEQTLLEIQDSRPIAERRKLKGLEIFVGGIDKDMTSEELKTIFEKVGNVLEIRMNRNSKTGKNKGYAFVRFSEWSEARKAVEEFHGSQISGKICRVTPSIENDILYLGNINKEWKKEDLTDALNKYKIENLEGVNLLEDPHHEGKNRGYAFLEFTSHKEALRAFNRLRQRDVVVGGNRTAKVAWAQPLSDPDEETMAQVKNVFVDGMPPGWDKERVKEHFGKFGEIERIVLGRDKASAKRKDFGFIDYATREAATACIEAVDNTEVGEGEEKVKLKVRLSKPVLEIKSGRGEVRGNYLIEKNDDGRGRSSHRDGKARNERRSSVGRCEKLGHSHSRGDASRGSRLDRNKRSSLGGVSASRRRSKFSSPHSGNDSASRRRRSKFSSPPLDRRGSRRERFSGRDGLSPRETRRDAYQYRRDDREYAERISGRKREFSALEVDPRYVEVPLGSRARLVHPEDLALPVGGSQYARIPYFESPARAPVGHVPQYSIGQPMALPAAPVQSYAFYDPISSAASGNPPYSAGGYPYGSVYSNGAEIARGTSYVSSPYGLPPPGASRYSVTGANLGPYY